MGAGCNNNNTSGRPVTPTPDTGVKYTGPDIEALSICTGDFLDEITAVIVQKLIDYSEAVGIEIPDIDIEQCDFLDSFITCCLQDKSLTAILNNILKTLCTLHDDDTDLQTQITTINNSINYTLVPGCLTPINGRIDSLLNKLVSEYCALVVKLENIFTDLDNPVFNTTIINEITDTVITKVFNNISGCSPNDLVKTGTGINTTIKVKGTVPIGTILFGKWDSSYFDGTGLGLDTMGMCGWHVCNGAGGTDDWRGLTPAMATNIAASVSLNPIVDPVANMDADLGTNIGDIKGKPKHLLSALEAPLKSHTHTTTQIPHTHANGVYDKLVKADGLYTLGEHNPDPTEPNLKTVAPMLPANANITINANAAEDATVKHENRQPTKYVNFIQRVA